MIDNNSGDDGRRQGNGRLLNSKRRSVLAGVAALGLGSSGIGTTAAHEDDENESDKGDVNGESSTSVSIQLYTLRNLPDTVPELIQRVGAVDNNGGPGYDAVEPAGLGEADPSEVADALDQNELTAPSAHIGLEEMENDFEDTVETYTQLGTDTFVVPYLGPEYFESRESVDELAQRFNDLAARLDDEGMRLGYHNHDHEFVELEDQTAFDAFVEATDDRVIFEIDVGWIVVAGYDPVALIEQHCDRVELIHMKDMTADGEFTEIGEGDVDMEAVANAARDHVDLLVYEHDEPENPAGSVATGAGVLSFLDGSEGLECIAFSDVGGPDYSGDIGY